MGGTPPDWTLLIHTIRLNMWAPSPHILFDASFLSCLVCSSTDVSRQDKTKQFQMGNDYPALSYWLRWSGYSRAGHSSWRLNRDLRGTPSDCLRIPVMLAAATEYFGPCICPMWPFQCWSCSKREETYEGEKFTRHLCGVKGLEVGGISARLHRKKIQTISYSPCFFPLTSTLLFGSALHRNICFLSPVSHPRPSLFSPCLQIVSAASILPAVPQKFVERLRQRSSTCW